MRSLLLGADNVINKCLRRGAAVPIYLPAPSLPRHSPADKYRILAQLNKYRG